MSNNLTDIDTRRLALAWQCFDIEPKVIPQLISAHNHSLRLPTFMFPSARTVDASLYCASHLPSTLCPRLSLLPSTLPSHPIFSQTLLHSPPHHQTQLTIPTSRSTTKNSPSSPVPKTPTPPAKASASPKRNSSLLALAMPRQQQQPRRSKTVKPTPCSTVLLRRQMCLVRRREVGRWLLRTSRIPRMMAAIRVL